MGREALLSLTWQVGKCKPMQRYHLAVAVTPSVLPPFRVG
jgi:hypothetical protein